MISLLLMNISFWIFITFMPPLRLESKTQFTYIEDLICITGTSMYVCNFGMIHISPSLGIGQ